MGRRLSAGRLPDARSSRWPGCGVPKHFNHRSPQERRDLAAPLRTSAGAGADAARAGRAGASRGRRRRGAAAAAPASCARTPATAARTGRSTPAGPSGAAGCSATPRRCAARWTAAPAPGPHVRPGLRAARRARLPAARRDAAGHRRRPDAGPDLDRGRPAGRRVPAGRRLGRAGRRRSWPRPCRCWSTRPAGTSRGPRPRCRAGPVRDAVDETLRLWAELEADEAAARAAADPASRIWASSGRSTAGPRRDADQGAGPCRRRRRDAGRRLRALVPAGDRPARSARRGGGAERPGPPDRPRPDAPWRGGHGRYGLARALDGMTWTTCLTLNLLGAPACVRCNTPLETWATGPNDHKEVTDYGYWPDHANRPDHADPADRGGRADRGAGTGRRHRRRQAARCRT